MPPRRVIFNCFQHSTIPQGDEKSNKKFKKKSITSFYVPRGIFFFFLLKLILNFNGPIFFFFYIIKI